MGFSVERGSMASGVKVAEEVKIKYDDIKKKKSYRYLVFYIKDEKIISVEKVGDREANYNDFLHDVTGAGPEDCRYGVYDFEYTHQCQGTSEATKKEKLFLMSWCPDSAKIKKKMLYSSSFDALKKCLVGIQKYIQATDESEASAECVEEQLRKMAGCRCTASPAPPSAQLDITGPVGYARRALMHLSSCGVRCLCLCRLIYLCCKQSSGCQSFINT